MLNAIAVAIFKDEVAEHGCHLDFRGVAYFLGKAPSGNAVVCEPFTNGADFVIEAGGDSAGRAAIDVAGAGGERVNGRGAGRNQRVGDHDIGDGHRRGVGHRDFVINVGTEFHQTQVWSRCLLGDAQRDVRRLAHEPC